MDNLAAMHGSLPNQGMMHHAGAHAKMPFGHNANNAFRAAHRASSDSSLAAAMAAAAGLGSGPNSPCSPAMMAAHAAAAAANHSRGGSPAADLAALQAAAVSGGASSSSGGGRLSRLSNSSSAFTDGPGGMGHMQPPRAGSALQGPLSAAQQQAAGMQGGHLGRAHSAPAPGPLLAAQQQQQQAAALAAGKAGMAAKHGDQQAMMQRMYGAGDRSTLSPPGLLSGRHAAAAAAAAAAPAGSESAGVPFSMGMNVRPVTGGPAVGHPLSPDAVRDTVGVRDTGAAAAAAYAAAEVQAQMQQQALAHQEQQVRESWTFFCFVACPLHGNDLCTMACHACYWHVCLPASTNYCLHALFNKCVWRVYVRQIHTCSLFLALLPLL
jgi:hypothetical protein